MKSFPSQISAHFVLDTGDYVVKGNNVVKSGATLTINSGTLFNFVDNGLIQIDGVLNITGSKNDFVEITSTDSSNPGVGFSILYESTEHIDIEYADFKYLKTPIKFHKYWLRPEVNIRNSMFHHLNHGVYFEILEMDKILAQEEVVMTIENNTFANNTGSFMISDAAWDLLHFKISNNVFSRNEYIGRELNGIFTTPLFLNYNEAENQLPQPELVDNSISFNYIGLIGMDTVEFLPVYVTTVGSADRIDISPNYFGTNAEKYLELNSEIVHATQRAPYLEFNNPLEKPKQSNNGHIYKVGVNGVEVDNPGYDLHIDQFTEVIELIGNRPLLPSPNFDVIYIYLDDDTLRRFQLNNELEFEDGNQRVKVTLKDKILKKMENGYIEVKGLIDQNGFEVPIVHIGIKHFLNKNREFLFHANDYQSIPRLDMTNRKYQIRSVDTTVGELLDTNLSIDDQKILKTENYWEFGVTTSSTIYFGDLASTSVSIYVPNARPQLGFRLGYNFNKKWKLQFSQNTLMLAGDDSKSSNIGKNRGTNFDRGLSFRTTVVDLGVNLVFRPFKYESLKSFIPSFLVGVSGYYFNPQAERDGTFYDLRTVGTEGQTLNGERFAYERFSYSIPAGIWIERHLTQKFLLGFGYTYHKLFTDYLDDVSTGRYPDADALKAANPDLGDVAVSLSNPNNQSGQRSYSGDNDGFSYFGFSFTWKL
ncbi:MAG: hypothetical protein JJ975_13065 [Bacteroidia bacterium]|nr:hypothetical protein [Bacteroidia bacterium]